MHTLGAITSTIIEKIRSLSWRFWVIASYFVIVLIFILTWVAFVVSPFNNEIMQRQIDNLTTTAKASAQTLSYLESAHTMVDSMAKDTDLRMTIIASDGTVLADSEINKQDMENHLTREEVQEAFAGDVGVAERDSATDGEQRIYVAVPANFHGDQVVLRLSEESNTVNAITDSILMTAVVLGVVGVILVIIVALFSLRRTVRPFKQLNQVRTDFVANASHELKTPVAAIRLLSEAINDAADLDDKKSLKLFLARLDAEADRLQRLVIDLLDLSRLETTQNEESEPRTDLHSTLMASYMGHRDQAEEKGLEMKLIDKSYPAEDCYAKVEPSDASLIFDNLIENAIMYTDEGSITVTFEVHVREITVSVEDTGIGIPQTDISRIFERFYRVDKARSREVGGTGLGLSLVRHAVDRSNGDIKLKSEVGEGSTFTVSLPKARARK